MLYVSLNEGRISKPVMLQVRLEALAKNGVLFSDCNATRLDASVSEDPSIVRFDLVKAAQYDVVKPLRQFYQAEVLVPSPLAPDLILFPNRPYIFGGGGPRKLLSLFLLNQWPRPPPTKPMSLF